MVAEAMSFAGCVMVKLLVPVLPPASVTVTV
jgi:hypothetical protein